MDPANDPPVHFSDEQRSVLELHDLTQAAGGIFRRGWVAHLLAMVCDIAVIFLAC
jgi:hypothetical protein